MVDITHKTTTLRMATAGAIVAVSRAETMQAIREKTVPKGDVLEMAKTAGLFAVKKTSDMIPDCHPLPIESTQVRYRLEGLQIHIEVEVRSIYRTGVEVEAIHGASIIAVTMYDMLKPIDPEIEIRSVRLIEKKGGKSDFGRRILPGLKAVVVVCSDRVLAGKKEDSAGQTVKAKLQSCEIELMDYVVLGNREETIREQAESCCRKGVDLLIFTGGTGLSSDDFTPEALKPILDFEIPGIAEAIRSHGQARTPYSMLSRSIAGVKGNTLILALPGSTVGAKESMDALFPSVLHAFRSLRKP